VPRHAADPAVDGGAGYIAPIAGRAVILMEKKRGARHTEEEE